MAESSTLTREWWQTDEYFEYVDRAEPSQDVEHYGRTDPRLSTPPLRPLTPETSLGFEVIDFADSFLNVELYPWQRSLLIRALELRPDGTYRFRRVIVLVARQQGKSMLASVLAIWWLMVDSDRHPDRLPPMDFRVLGTAQNLDTARDVWMRVRQWCDPDVDPEEDDAVVPALMSSVQKVSDTNGKEEIILKSKARYLIRAASRKSGRGKSTARVLMDEMREQLDWSAWDSVSQTTKAIFNSQLWAFSNAGDSRSKVLNHQRKAALEFIDGWERYVTGGVMSAEEFANSNNDSLALFEWSAPDGAAMNDVEGILQANPSVGWGELTVSMILADISGMTEAGFRTEVLCQWVSAMTETFFEAAEWAALLDRESSIVDGSELCLGVDTEADRSFTSVSVAGWRADGLVHGENIASRAGMMWAPAFIGAVAEAQGITHVAVQVRGSRAGEFKQQLTDLGLEIVEINGPAFSAVAGQTKDRIRSRGIRHLDQPALDLSIENVVTKKLNEADVWDRTGSQVHSSPAISLAHAVYGLVSTGAGSPPLVSAYVLQGDEEQQDWW